jgi:rhodanese-related sulfurtransferase
MWLIGICAVGFFVLAFGLYRMKRVREMRKLEEHSIDAEALHELLEAKREEVLLFDVRLPLDLLAHSEIIPGARRIAPKEIAEQPSLLPREKSSVVYCTCVSEKTSRMILKKALALGFKQVRFLKGGLDGWKAKGYPVERYETPFHLDTAF